VESGEIKFGDLAGGASHALLLWYAGVRIDDGHAVKIAKRCLSKFKKSKYASDFDKWPRPLALLANGRSQPGAVLDGLVAFEEKEKKEEMEGFGPVENKNGRRHLPIQSEFVQALFFMATHYREVGKEDACRKHLYLCACMENPVLTIEWYLARHELGWRAT
jgi:hypothetical protein